MSRNTEATEEVGIWTGGRLNYKEGFFTQLPTDELAKGISEEVVRAISAKRNEPEWDAGIFVSMPIEPGWTWMNRTG
ncbi:Iron-sulfur cluster assembly protein SufB [Salmonella enterica subsp. enterica]|nr:Iron-sulfur cluster assembly protein SufB [Salmonella enterica subsp. enterica]